MILFFFFQFDLLLYLGYAGSLLAVYRLSLVITSGGNSLVVARGLRRSGSSLGPSQ